MARRRGGDGGESPPAPDPERAPSARKAGCEPLLLVPAGLGVLVLCLVFWIARPPGAMLGFPLDDSWIHMVYGRSLADEGRLAYNPGTPATGSTSPLWALVLGATHLLLGRASLDVLVSGVMVVGCVFHLLGIVFLARWMLRFTGDRVAALATGSLLALATPYAAAGFSGMEVTLCGWLLLAGVWSCASAPGWRAGLWLALACLARPEAAAVLVLCLGAAPFATKGAPARERAAAVARTAAPAVALGTLLLIYYWHASGRPLPATFYFKQVRHLADLPARLQVAIAAIFSRIPPFAGWIGWSALLGLVPLFAQRILLLPFAAAVTFLLANLYVMPPSDPPAFYHQRYLMPAVPLMISALGLGAWSLGRRLPGRAAPLAPLALLAVGLAGGALTVRGVSAHLHNDVRNINEVQRSLGTWLDEHAPPGAWIAASDAGAVRYFSRRPVVDVMGLNTPEFYWQRESYVASHPVAAAVLMPAWFSIRGQSSAAILAVRETADYTVTSNPRMARQVIVGNRGTAPAAIAVAGLRNFSLVLLPWTSP